MPALQERKHGMHHRWTACGTSPDSSLRPTCHQKEVYPLSATTSAHVVTAREPSGPQSARPASNAVRLRYDRLSSYECAARPSVHEARHGVGLVDLKSPGQNSCRKSQVDLRLSSAAWTSFRLPQPPTAYSMHTLPFAGDDI